MNSIFSNKIRNDSSAKRTSESYFRFIDRSSDTEVAKVRSEIDALLALYPSNSRGALISRLRARDDHQFESASFELLLYKLLMITGNDVLGVEPETDSGKTPDFFLRHKSGQEYYLEATVERGASERRATARKRLQDFSDGLKKLRSPRYHLGLTTSEFPKEQLSVRSVRSAIQKWIDNLPEELLAAKNQKQKFDLNGFEFSLRVVGERGPKSKSPIGMHSLPVFSRTPGEGIRESVFQKGARYRNVNEPFLVAISVSTFSGDKEDLEAALFGSPNITIRTFEDGTTEEFGGQNPDGAFLGKQPRYRNISAAIAFSNFSIWGCKHARAMAFHHPWANAPIPKCVFPYDQFFPNHALGELELIPGKQVSELMQSASFR